MIYVKRPQDIPSVLNGPNSKGVREKNDAIAHIKSKSPVPFPFKIYRDPSVKNALSILFNGKCAYCESNVVHIYPGDVEHFRPKSKIAEEKKNPKPGYYWLAADWENLLFSCRDCNQQRGHLVHGAKEVKTLGKMDQFPLLDPDKRVRKHDDVDGIKKEEPLLINPCIDKPEDHFEYDVKHALVKPKKIKGQNSAKGEKSIEVYVLQRVPLVQARQRVLTDVFAQIQRVDEAVKDVSNHLAEKNPIKLYYDKILQRELTRLKEYTLPTQEYSAMCKQVVGQFLKLNFGIEL